MQRKCFNTFLLVFLVTALLASCASKRESETSVSNDNAAAANLIRQADDLYRQREDPDKLRSGITLLKRARNADSRSFEAQWKLAKFNYYLGSHTNDDKESEAAFKEGSEAGKIASNLAAGKADGYFWMGANLGGRAQKHPLTEGITSIGAIREQMNKVIEIQPDYQGASAYDVLAQIELATWLTGGSSEKALEYLEKAVEIEKNNSFTRLHLAETYLALNRKADAKKEIDFILKMTPDPDYLPEYKESAEEAKKLLKKRF